MSQIWSGRLTRRLFAAHFAFFALMTLTAGLVVADAEVAIVQPGDPESFRYEPGTLTVSVGTTVNWVNEGSTPVTVTSPDGLFDSEQIQPGGTFRVTFDTPGTFRYFCVPYPHMKGTIVVTRESSR